MSEKSTHELSIWEYQQKQAAELINGIDKDLTNISNTDISRLEEYLFVSVFLPIFAGDNDRLYPEANMLTWLNVSGGPYRSVHVIDASGTVLFEVPPILDRAAINTLTNVKGPSISSVVATSDLYGKLHPSQGLAYLSKELTKRALVMRAPQSILKDLEIWNSIFARYGRPPIVVVNKENINNNEGETTTYDYEPL